MYFPNITKKIKLFETEQHTIVMIIKKIVILRTDNVSIEQNTGIFNRRQQSNDRSSDNIVEGREQIKFTT